jgi:salicylate hydroxylase
MLQYLAQGACQALVDAVCLSERVRENGNDLERAFVEYEELRAPRTARVQSNARVFGDIIHADIAGQLTRNALLKFMASDDFRYVDWLYGAFDYKQDADPYQLMQTRTAKENGDVQSARPL